MCQLKATLKMGQTVAKRFGCEGRERLPAVLCYSISNRETNSGAPSLLLSNQSSLERAIESFMNIVGL